MRKPTTLFGRRGLANHLHTNKKNRARQRPQPPAFGDGVAVEQRYAGHGEGRRDHVDESEIASGDAEGSRQIGTLAAQSHAEKKVNTVVAPRRKA